MSSWVKTKKTLLEKINFKNKTILDVGCGSGWFSIWVSNNGAKEIYGIDPLRDQIENAKRSSKNKKMNFKLGFAEDLPFKDNKFDCVFFFNSLHHVSTKFMNKAIEEAGRVIKETGDLYIIEPLSEGTFNETLKLIDDEKEIRFKAYESIKKFCSDKVIFNKEIFYEEKIKFDNFSEFCSTVLSADPGRKTNINKFKKELRNIFNNLSVVTDNKYQLIQPMRMNIIEFNKN